MTLSLLRLPLLAALMLPLVGNAAGGADALAQRHAAALVEYEACHWVQAYRAFAALADEGHQPAARVALLMAAHGSKLYGQAFDASVAQRKRWAMLPAGDGQIVASMPVPQGR